MRIVTWTIRVLVFLLLVGFAAKNVEPVTLRFYFDLALLGTVLRQRREISSLKASMERQPAAPVAEFPPSVIPPPI